MKKNKTYKAGVGRAGLGSNEELGGTVTPVDLGEKPKGGELE